MQERVDKTHLAGRVRIPASKSHTIRALIFATLAEGRSRIQNPLDSNDTRSCVNACKLLGAKIVSAPGEFIVDGTAGRLTVPENVIDVGNSGTTMYLCAGAAALAPGWSFFSGDGQIRKRSIEHLLNSLKELGAQTFTSRDNGCAPFAVRGPLIGGRTTIESHTSQWLSSLLMTLPIVANDSEIEVPILNERPYVKMTLGWLDELGIKYETEEMRRFRVPGGQIYRGFTRQVPADFSSATFFLCAAAITKSTLTLDGLDMNDTQGDKAVVDILREMGCEISIEDKAITITGKELSGGEFDLNSMPDALPALAATACYANHDTRLVNVPQARAKETDRIHIMAEELRKMGADIDEAEDGMTIHPSRLKGDFVNGNSDHRVVMALAIAGLGATGATIIDTAETAAVTFPTFFEDLRTIMHSSL
ncbi:MAG TPA: 3-phosphoshikimate 1-carboxyvinyltransferase [Spirochaetia bacterium]|nr:3-phosphoshikimate 1-carboxyvinyltransferase [Spirochaetia bacterium]